MRSSPHDFEDQKDLLGHALAVRVEVESEEFDRTLPGGPSKYDDTWTPEPGPSMQKALTHAKRLRAVAEMVADVLNLGPVPRCTELRQSHEALKSELALYRRQPWWTELDDAWKTAFEFTGPSERR